MKLGNMFYFVLMTFDLYKIKRSLENEIKRNDVGTEKRNQPNDLPFLMIVLTCTGDRYNKAN